MMAHRVNEALQSDVSREDFFSAVRRDVWANRQVRMLTSNQSLFNYCLVDADEGPGLMAFASEASADTFAALQTKEAEQEGRDIRYWTDVSSIERTMWLAEDKYKTGVYLCGDGGYCRMFSLEQIKLLSQLTKRVRKGGELCTEQPLFVIHSTSYSNGETVRNATHCGCFHCLKMFEGSAVTQFIREADGTETARCPYCGLDSVITDYKYYLVSMGWLERMHERFFSRENDSGVPLALKAEYLEIMRQMAREIRERDRETGMDKKKFRK